MGGSQSERYRASRPSEIPVPRNTDEGNPEYSHGVAVGDGYKGDETMDDEFTS